MVDFSSVLAASGCEGVCVSPHCETMTLICTHSPSHVLNSGWVHYADAHLSVPVSPVRIVPAQPDEGRQISVAVTPASAALHRFWGLVSSLAPQSWVMARHTTTWSDSAWTGLSKVVAPLLFSVKFLARWSCFRDVMIKWLKLTYIIKAVNLLMTGT